MAADNVVTKRMKIIADLQKELNVLKEQLEDTQENDRGFQEAEEALSQLKEEVKVQKEIQARKVETNTALKGVKEEIKEKKQDIKDNREILAVELVEYYKETGKLEIEDHEGNIKKLKFSVRLAS